MPSVGKALKREKDEGGTQLSGHRLQHAAEEERGDLAHCGRCVGQVTVEDGPIESPASQQEARRDEGEEGHGEPQQTLCLESREQRQAGGRGGGRGRGRGGGSAA